MVKIVEILVKETNSFGDLKVVFIGDDKKIYTTSTCEGDHSSLQVGKFASSPKELTPDNKGNIIFSGKEYNVVMDLSNHYTRFNRELWVYFACDTLECNKDFADRVADVVGEIINREGYIENALSRSVNPCSTEDRIVVRTIAEALKNPESIHNKVKPVMDGYFINHYREILLRMAS